MQSSYTHIRTMQYESANFSQILVFTTVTSNSPIFLPAKFSRYTVWHQTSRRWARETLGGGTVPSSLWMKHWPLLPAGSGIQGGVQQALWGPDGICSAAPCDCGPRQALHPSRRSSQPLSQSDVNTHHDRRLFLRYHMRVQWNLSVVVTHQISIVWQVAAISRLCCMGLVQQGPAVLTVRKWWLNGNLIPRPSRPSVLSFAILTRVKAW